MSSDDEESDRADRIGLQDGVFHDWYRFILSFPPDIVRSYIGDFGLDERSVILDPFCGTGTTLVEAKLNGIRSIGLEANPFARFVSSVKVDWSIDADELAARARDIANSALNILGSHGIDDNRPFDGNPPDIPLRTLSPEATKLILSNSISPLPLHKTLVLLDCLKEHLNEPYYQHGLLALANALVSKIGNLRFGPEVGVTKPKDDAPVVVSPFGR
jgi:hypothetical protein